MAGCPRAWAAAGVVAVATVGSWGQQVNSGLEAGVRWMPVGPATRSCHTARTACHSSFSGPRSDVWVALQAAPVVAQGELAVAAAGGEPARFATVKSVTAEPATRRSRPRRVRLRLRRQ